VTSFAFRQPPLFVSFGAGTLDRLPDALRACDGVRALLIASPSQHAVASRAEELLGAACAGRFNGVAPHVPGSAVDALGTLAGERDPDVLVALGGGSAIDLCKAAAAGTAMRVLAIPTTYGGSELTAHAGRTDGGNKSAVASGPPRAVIYDPELTYDLPARAGAGSAMNALAHCVEALYAPRPQPLALLAAEEGLRRIPPALRATTDSPRSPEDRAELLFGAYLAAVALAGSGMALHHRICHVLGGRYGIAHGDANAVILPHAARFNAPAAPDALARVARALGTDDAAAGLAQLARDAGAAGSLQELGLERAEFPTIAELALAQPLVNPRPVEPADIVALLERAWTPFDHDAAARPLSART
jgi:alcohol dehydrogenase class IV